MQPTTSPMPPKVSRKEKDKPRITDPKMAAASVNAAESPQRAPVLAEIKEAMSAILDDKLGEIAVQIKEIKASITELTSRLDEAEARISTLEDQAALRDSEIAGLKTQLKQQHEKIDDLENRSRRSNLRFLGIPKSVEDRQLGEVLSVWLMEAFQLQNNIAGPIIIERAHRMGARKDSESRPRIVIAKLLNFAQKQAIMTAYRKRSEVLFQGNRIRLFQDYSNEVSVKRREFSKVCSLLFAKQKKFSLQFPARLNVWHGEKVLSFDTAAVAQEFVDGL